MSTQAERNKLAFVEGLRLIFDSWTVLRLAIDQEFGGVSSKEKGLWLLDTVIEAFEKKKGIDVEYLEELFDDVLQDEFQTIAEDGSITEVSRKIMDLFRQCIQGNYSILEELREKAALAQQNVSKSVKEQSSLAIGENGEAESTSGEEDGDDNDESSDADSVMSVDYGQDTTAPAPASMLLSPVPANINNPNNSNSNLFVQPIQQNPNPNPNPNPNNGGMEGMEEEEGWQTVGKKKGKKK